MTTAELKLELNKIKKIIPELEKYWDRHFGELPENLQQAIKKVRIIPALTASGLEQCKTILNTLYWAEYLAQEEIEKREKTQSTALPPKPPLYPSPPETPASPKPTASPKTFVPSNPPMPSKSAPLPATKPSSPPSLKEVPPSAKQTSQPLPTVRKPSPPTHPSTPPLKPNPQPNIQNPTNQRNSNKISSNHTQDNQRGREN